MRPWHVCKFSTLEVLREENISHSSSGINSLNKRLDFTARDLRCKIALNKEPVAKVTIQAETNNNQSINNYTVQHFKKQSKNNNRTSNQLRRKKLNKE